MTEDEIAATLTVETPEMAAALEAPGALLAAALYYAGIGWPVFPLVPGEKRPLTTNGFKDASLDPGQVAAWWTATPTANIGVPTGIRFDVLDIDSPDGFASYAELKAEAIAGGHDLPEILAVAATGSGGRHLLVPVTGRGNAAGLRPGIDWRGLGGYIVAPPSRLTGGDRYVWTRPPHASLLGVAA